MEKMSRKAKRMADEKVIDSGDPWLIAAWLKNLRAGMDISQRELAKMIGKHPQTVFAWENRGVVPAAWSPQVRESLLEVSQKSRELSGAWFRAECPKPNNRNGYKG
jgi:DNA-binding transcriptional regulator YiaG